MRVSQDKKGGGGGAGVRQKILNLISGRDYFLELKSTGI